MTKKFAILCFMAVAFFMVSCASPTAPVRKVSFPTDGPAPKVKVTILEKEPERTDFTISGTLHAGAAGNSLEPGAVIVLMEADLDGTSVRTTYLNGSTSVPHREIKIVIDGLHTRAVQ